MPLPGSWASVFDSALSRLDFVGLLAALHQLLGLELEVIIYLPKGSFAAGFQARLMTVAELPPDCEAVTLRFKGDEMLTLAPDEVVIHCGLSRRRGEPTRWIEVDVQHGPNVVIEEAVRQS